MNFSLVKRCHYGKMLAALGEHCSPLVRMILVIILWMVHAQTIVARSILYLFYIGALPTRPNSSSADLKDKNHVLSYIHIYRWLLVANTYLPIALSAMLIDSYMAYPWNIVSVVIIHTFLQNMLKRLARRWQLNPPVDDFQYCRVLIRVRSVFLFCPGVIVSMFFIISIAVSAPQWSFSTWRNSKKTFLSSSIRFRFNWSITTPDTSISRHISVWDASTMHRVMTYEASVSVLVMDV